MEVKTHPQPKDTPSSDADEPSRYIRFRRSHFYSILVALVLIAGFAGGYLFRDRTTPPQAAPDPAESPSTSVEPDRSAPFTRLEVSTDDDPALGPEDAPVVVVEFSDFNCPFCQRFHQETFADLMQSYDGQIRFVYRDFPIVGGGQVGYQAAQAANCAAEQGDYWVFHDALFSGQYSLDRSGFGQYAADLGLDADELGACLESARYADEVRADFRAGVDLGVTGTPTFFINGIPLVGAQPLVSFTEVIDAELGR